MIKPGIHCPYTTIEMCASMFFTGEDGDMPSYLNMRYVYFDFVHDDRSLLIVANFSGWVTKQA